ncbi:MAG TPA: DUF4097 family beta strand repeat-containing protein [Vicinamibacterales bacterium]|nr:DUF4097 family beta strand repeat-containing protein [Vicinamibacterales bacterium]
MSPRLRPAVRATAMSAGLIAITMAAPACVVTVDNDGQIERVEKRFNVDKTVELRLTTFDGAIEVRSWDRPEVLVQIDKRGPDKDALGTIDVVAEQKADVIQVEARHTATRTRFVGLGFFVSASAKMIASVPRNTNLVIRTEDGSIVLERVAGKADLHTKDGSIRASETSGELVAETGDGSLQLDDVSGRLELRTGDGSIRLSGTPSSLKARSGDGSIALRIQNGAMMDDDWTIVTADGSISLALPDGFAAQIDADPGSDGKVRSDLTLSNTAGGTRDKRTFTGALGQGGHRLSIRTGDGTIRLTGY